MAARRRWLQAQRKVTAWTCPTRRSRARRRPRRRGVRRWRSARARCRARPGSARRRCAGAREAHHDAGRPRARRRGARCGSTAAGSARQAVRSVRARQRASSPLASICSSAQTAAGAWCKPSQQSSAAPSAAVGVLGTEGSHALRAERLGGLGRRVALDEGQRDRRVDVGEDRGCAGPERLQQGAQLVGQLHSGSHQIVATAHQSAQCENLVALRRQGLEAVAVRAQQVSQHVGVGGVALAAVASVARAAGLDSVGVDGNDREAGLDQGVDQQARRSLDGHRRRAEAAQAALQLGQARGVVVDLELLDDPTALVDDAQRVRLAGPVQPGKGSCSWTTSFKLRYDSPCRKPTRDAH